MSADVAEKGMTVADLGVDTEKHNLPNDSPSLDTLILQAEREVEEHDKLALLKTTPKLLFAKGGIIDSLLLKPFRELTDEERKSIIKARDITKRVSYGLAKEDPKLLEAHIEFSIGDNLPNISQLEQACIELGMEATYLNYVASHVAYETGKEDVTIYEKAVADTVWGDFCQGEKGQNIVKKLRRVALLRSDIPRDFFNHIGLRIFQEAHTGEEYALGAQIGAQQAKGIMDFNQYLRVFIATHPEFANKFSAYETALGFPEGAQADLRTLYEGIVEEFAHYEPNEQLNRRETQLLLHHLKGKERLIDVAAGTTRLTASLTAEGKKVVAVDMVPDLLKYGKQQNPKINAVAGTWDSLPLPDGYFDGGYCLGRSLLHNVTVEDFITCLKEINRVLTPDACFIIDLPNVSAGHYIQAREDVQRKLYNRGIPVGNPGFIHDSPDGEHFFDRFSPDNLQLLAMCFVAGFVPEMIGEDIYTDSDNFENKNVYWKLEKHTTSLVKPQEELLKQVARLGIDHPLSTTLFKTFLGEAEGDA